MENKPQKTDKTQEQDLKKKTDKGILEAMGEMTGKAVDMVSDIAGKALDTMGDVAGITMECVENIAGKAIDTAGDATVKAVDIVGGVTDKATDAAEYVADKAGKTFENVGDAAIKVGSAVCGGISDFASGMINATKFLTSSQYRREVGYPWLQATLSENWGKVNQELKESEEMLTLIWKYANGKKLSEDETKAVKEQLLDLVRVIPALGIFLLPGGLILLPILAKALPWRLTPSAFQKKMEEENGPEALNQTLSNMEESPCDTTQGSVNDKDKLMSKEGKSMSDSYAELFDSLHVLEIKVLRAFIENERLLEEKIASLTSLDPARLRRAVEWLLSKQAMIVFQQSVTPVVSLTEQGKLYATNNIPELRIIDSLSKSDLPMQEIQSIPDLPKKDISTAIGILKKAGAIEIAGGKVSFNKSADLSSLNERQSFMRDIDLRGQLQFESLTPVQKEWVENFRESRGKAGIFKISDLVEREFSLTELGKKLRDECVARGKTGEEVTRLTQSMLQDGSWQGKEFSKYYLKFKPKRLVVGRRHPYRQFLDFVKRKLISLGFEEMRGSLVENEFWNMDALYMPQFHSARDIHDVYFIKNPTRSKEIEEPYYSQVREAHQNGGGTGSLGWRYKFDTDRAKRLILRSQGTVLSARTLASKPHIPGKYFAQARCFRYDQIDATHAADFYQVEGIVLGEEINFCHLLGLLKLFALEIAKSKEVKFVPGYFPFTEPSVEVHMKHPKLGWIELGGAGIFRPELTHALGVDVPVIAWGLGLDRMAMVALEIHDIRDLFSGDLDMIRSKRMPIKD